MNLDLERRRIVRELNISDGCPRQGRVTVMEPRSNMCYSVLGKDLNSSNSYYTQRPELATTRKLTKMTGCLEIIGADGSEQAKSVKENPSNSRASSSASTRSWSRGSLGYVPSRADSSFGRRMNTPTKQISLQAVRRKEESTETFVDQVDWQSLGHEGNHVKTSEPGSSNVDIEPPNTLVQADSFRLEPVGETSQHATQLSLLQPDRVKEEDASQLKHFSDSGSVIAPQGGELNDKDKSRDEKNNEEDDGNDDDDDSDSSDEEEDELRAPNELLMEFVDCIMRKDFPTASKLCKMILLFEPANPEALKFQPLIEERIALDAEAEEEEANVSDEDDDNASDNEDEEDEDDDCSDDDSDDEESSSDEDLSDEDDDNADDVVVQEKVINNSNNNNNNVHFGSHSRSCHHRV